MSFIIAVLFCVALLVMGGECLGDGAGCISILFGLALIGMAFTAPPLVIVAAIVFICLKGK